MMKESRIERFMNAGANQLRYTITGLEFANYPVRLAGFTEAVVGKSTESLEQVPMEGGEGIFH